MIVKFVLLGWLAIAAAAPAEPLTPAGVSRLEPRQYLILSPQAQLQLEPALKLQQPIIQPLSSFGKIQTQNDQMILLYPSTSINQIPLVSLKQGNNWIDNINTWIQSWGFGQPSENPEPSEEESSGSEDSQKLETAPRIGILNEQKKSEEVAKMPSAKLEFNDEAETVPVMPQTPAATVPMPDRRFFVVGGRPQFFGNFDALQNPFHPIFSLQPLQSVVKARSISDPLEEIRQDDKPLVPQVPASESLPSQLPLRVSNDGENMENVENPIVEEAPVDSNARNFAQFLVEQKVLNPSEGQLDSDKIPVAIEPRSQVMEPSELNKPQTEAKDEEVKDDIGLRLSDNPSVAQARPVALAVSGKGGLSQAIPLSTAIVGNNGLAISAPYATSVAGDFSRAGGDDTVKVPDSEVIEEKDKIE